jgi:hypothetical protein
LDERINRCAGVYLTRLYISKLRFAPAQRGAVCAVFFKEMRVFESKRR